MIDSVGCDVADGVWFVSSVGARALTACMETVRSYELLEGWTNPGEQAAIEYLTAAMRSHPILDIGGSAGRTTLFLQQISEDYIGIDYTPEMIDQRSTGNR